METLSPIKQANNMLGLDDEIVHTSVDGFFKEAHKNHLAMNVIQRLFTIIMRVNLLRKCAMNDHSIGQKLRETGRLQRKKFVFTDV